MKEFFINYGQYIIVGVLCLLEIILFSFKNRPKLIDNSLITKLCSWILEAEGIYKTGSDKMNFVLEKAKDYLKDSYQETEIRNIIEYLLTIPEKKVK